jgi:hypothetical protein
MRRVATILGTAAVVMLATSVFAQTPNFAGKWTRDAEKTAAMAPAGAPAGGGGRGGGGAADITITQDAKTLVISRMAGETEIKTTYNLDGSPSKNTMMGRQGGTPTEVTSTAKWDGAKLVITSDNGQTVTYSMDGAWLVQSSTRPGRDGGPAITTAVYWKKAS